MGGSVGTVSSMKNTEMLLLVYFFFPQKGAENYTFSRVLKYLGRKLGH